MPKVWNIKLHMPTGAGTDATDTDAITDTAIPDAWTVAVATEAFPAGTGAPWHALQRHVP